MSQPSRSPLQPALFSSASDEWPTPQWLYDSLAREFSFSLDPCACASNAKCRNFFTREQDGLRQAWTGHTVFMNPPYGRVIGRWIEKAYQTSREGSLVVALLPARTDASWWHDYVMKGEIRLLRGRLTFEGGKYPAPFPSAIVVFRPPQSSMTSVPAKKPKNIGQEGLPL